jgi:16S rRNA (cytosine967-C5)-methyltransferase
MVDLENIHTAPEVIKKNIPKNGVQLILADVPCSGSGTWGRSPEWLRFFNEKDLLVFQNKQINIVKSLIPSLKPGGHFIYITCSVFQAENEKVVESILGSSKLELVEKKLFSGFEEVADQLFAALFTLKA